MTRDEAEKHIRDLYGIPDHDSGAPADDLLLDVVSAIGFAALTDVAVIALAKAQIRLHHFSNK